MQHDVCFLFVHQTLSHAIPTCGISGILRPPYLKFLYTFMSSCGSIVQWLTRHAADPFILCIDEKVFFEILHTVPLPPLLWQSTVSSHEICTHWVYLGCQVQLIKFGDPLWVRNWLEVMCGNKLQAGKFILFRHSNSAISRYNHTNKSWWSTHWSPQIMQPQALKDSYKTGSTPFVNVYITVLANVGQSAVGRASSNFLTPFPINYPLNTEKLT